MKYLYSLLSICAYVYMGYANFQNEILVDIGVDNANGSAQNVDEQSLFSSGRNILFAFLGVTAVAMILWVALNYLTADGKEDQHKKNTQSLIHILIGLAVIPAAYFIVKSLLNLSF